MTKHQGCYGYCSPVWCCAGLLLKLQRMQVGLQGGRCRAQQQQQEPCRESS